MKGRTGGPLRSSPWISDYEPLRAHEMIHVFKRKGAKTGDLTFNLGAMHRGASLGAGSSGTARPTTSRTGEGDGSTSSDGWRYPVDVVFSSPSTEGDLFAAKPEDLVTLLLATLTKAGDRVLDPYAGSGTTLRVCHKLGRRSLGIEASPQSWAILKRNLAGLRGLGVGQGAPMTPSAVCRNCEVSPEHWIRARTPSNSSGRPGTAGPSRHKGRKPPERPIDNDSA